MGSRIMHAIIASRIADYFSIKDRTSFLLGGIAPDAVSTKNESHFFTGEVSDYTRSVNFEQFLEKYSSKKNSEYILGYYTHLVADDIWLKGFNLPWLRNRLENDENMINLHHNDFRLLNGKLLNYYSFTNKLKVDLQKDGKIIELQEVSIGDVEKFTPYVLGDLNYSKNDIQQQLNVYTFQQIIGYIETSIDKGIQHIKSHKLLV